MSVEAPMPRPETQETKREFRRVPILPNWYESYRNSNLKFPRNSYGIFPLVGHEIVKSLREEKVDLGYVTYSRLTSKQFSDLQNVLIDAHTAFGIPAKPHGHAKEGETEFSAHEWLNGNWNDVKTSVVRTLAYFGATKHPANMDIKEIGKSSVNRLAWELRRQTWWEIDDGNLDDLIQSFMESIEYENVLPQVAKLYETVAMTLQSDTIQQFARQRKATMSSSYEKFDDDYFDEGEDGEYIDEDYEKVETIVNYERESIRFMKRDLDALGIPYHGIDEASVLFLNAVTGRSRGDIISLSRYNHINRRHIR